ncbi:hypothetical protein ABL78_0039 [Leptomonas seymouri]|uniref:PSP1 C-terminal domain-containing protein n=1 Tax=Leptomonas seymouri TaxID=5684 RepID=A0A0N0P982_LEPSE|nr:hypothetical protein ABL78_0039 [Leptomonas seymouri]|eukprot:KPI90806.1 hypothetical protein ABL78_0039 [Leptomonas seymouri]
MSAAHTTANCATPILRPRENEEEAAQPGSALVPSGYPTTMTSVQALDEFKAVRQHLAQLLTDADCWIRALWSDTPAFSESGSQLHSHSVSNQTLPLHDNKQISQTQTDAAGALPQIHTTLEDIRYILDTCVKKVCAALSRQTTAHPSPSTSCGISPANTPYDMHRSNSWALHALNANTPTEVGCGSASPFAQSIPLLCGFAASENEHTAEHFQAETPHFVQRFATKHPCRMRWPPAQFCYVVHVEFKRGRVRRFFNRFLIDPGAYALVPGDRGYDCGLVIQCALWNPHKHAYEADTVQSLDATIWPPGSHGTIMEVIRLASDSEVYRLHNEHVSMERLALNTCRDVADRLHLQMEVVDCEYQYDGTKISFFFDSTEMIDFRQLNKELYRVFNARIWMQNINAAVRNAAPPNAASSQRWRYRHENAYLDVAVPR